MHSEHKFKAQPQNYAPRVCGIRYSQANQPTSQATGEWVGDEKIAERRVATKARITSQSSPRVFSEIFCSTYPERGARQPTRQVPQQATPASQLGKFPKSTTLAHQRSRLSQSAALVHNAGKHPQTHQP